MFPQTRLRRLRSHPVLRDLVRETSLSVHDFILPLFVRPGKNIKNEIASMPGNYQLSVDRLVDEVGAAVDLGIRAFIFFGIPASKDAQGSSAWQDDGIVQQALRAVRPAFKDVLLITDECFCEYTDHGHCGVLSGRDGKLDVDNDATLPNLARQCVSHVKAGADMVAPSGMMDGMVAAIRKGLDDAGLKHAPILSYAAKYASGFYGPFRDAAESPPSFGDRSTYQMDPANSDEALREVALDLDEGADIVMVKPALSYLDIIRRVKDRFGVPVAAYNVSGEFAMVKAAAAKGWIDERRVTLEILTSIKRAGADMILTYHALDAARWLAQAYVERIGPCVTNPEPPMLIGKELGPYLVDEELGSGAMATVFRARNKDNGERVAVKLLWLNLLADEAAVARFIREVAILKQLDHPNIVHYKQSGRYRKAPFYIMEYLDGESLDHILERRTKLPWEEVVSIGIDLCAALQHAHDRGIIHRDLKPSNLMILKDGGVRLTDFGIAKDTALSALTASNITVGTAAYMSPEQCRGRRDITHKTDLYSMGVLFYELLTGRKPFVGATPMEVFLQHANKTDYKRPNEIVLELPISRFNTLVEQLMEKEPAKRPLSARAVADSLQVVKRKIETQRKIDGD